MTNDNPGNSYEGGTCPDCDTSAVWRECEDCGIGGWDIDCGHEAQPTPLAPDADGYCLCDDCAEVNDREGY